MRRQDATDWRRSQAACSTSFRAIMVAPPNKMASALGLPCNSVQDANSIEHGLIEYAIA